MADYPVFDGLGTSGEYLRYREGLAQGDAPVPSALQGEVTEFESDSYKIYLELYNLLMSKHKDYGPKNIADSPGGAINGLRVRMHDKLARINNLYDNKRDALNEPLEDSFKDMANYAIIGLLVLRDKWDK